MVVRACSSSGGVSVGASIVPRGDGKAVGTMRAVGGDWGLALLRLQAALPIADGVADSKELVVETAGGGSCGVVPVRPAWWPVSWGREGVEEE